MKVATAQLREDFRQAQVATLGPPPDCRTTFQQIAERCIKAIEVNQAQAASGDPEAIHAMRIELTWLRAARRFFSPIINDTAWAGIDRQLRWLNSVLGRARNCDVLMQYAGRKRYRGWARHSRRDMLRSQGKAHRRLARKLGSARYNRMTSELKDWISNPPSPHIRQAPQFDQVDLYCDERLREWRDEISRQGRHIGALGRTALHRLRIHSKHYRYMVEALLALDIPISREGVAFCETAKQVHQALGDLRDLRRLRKSVGRRPPHYRKRKRKLIRQAEHSFRRLS